jgi:hypothetical protein
MESKINVRGMDVPRISTGAGPDLPPLGPWKRKTKTRPGTSISLISWFEYHKESEKS